MLDITIEEKKKKETCMVDDANTWEKWKLILFFYVREMTKHNQPKWCESPKRKETFIFAFFAFFFLHLCEVYFVLLPLSLQIYISKEKNTTL